MSLRFLIAAGALSLLAACSGPYSSPVAAKESAKALAVDVRAARLQTIPEVVTATGELFAEDQATLGVKVAGRVKRLLVDLGSVVEQGAVIAEIEKEDYEFRVRQSEAMVEQTRARLGLGPNDQDTGEAEKTSVVRQAAAGLREARLMNQNASALFKQGVISNVDFQRAGVALQGAEARYQAAVEEVYRSRAELLERRAQLALARQQLSDTELRAPFRGAITRRIATAGEFLPVNGPVAQLVRSNPLRIRLEVPERLAGRIRAGQRIDLNVTGAPSLAPGRVVRISPALDAQSRSLAIEGEIPNPDNFLRAGSFVEGVLTLDPNARGYAVPQSAIVSFAGVDRVFVADGGALAERVIRVGRRIDDSTVEITEGLHDGDLVVLKGNDRMTVGLKVDPRPR